MNTGGRLASLRFHAGIRVRMEDVIAQIEHADIEAQLEAARRVIGEADAQLLQITATRDGDARNVEWQRALIRDGVTTTHALTAAESAHAVTVARVKSAEAAIASALVKVAEEALENTNARTPVDHVVEICGPDGSRLEPDSRLVEEGRRASSVASSSGWPDRVDIRRSGGCGALSHGLAKSRHVLVEIFVENRATPE